MARDCGIINFPEWQTLDVWRAVLSHPLPGVPQPPSVLPVNLRPLHLPSRAAIHRQRTLDAQSRVNDRTQARLGVVNIYVCNLYNIIASVCVVVEGDGVY